MLALHPLTKTIRIAIHEQNVRPMCHPIESCRRHLLIDLYIDPFSKVQVRRYDRTTPSMASREHGKSQSPSVLLMGT